MRIESRFGHDIDQWAHLEGVSDRVDQWLQESEPGNEFLKNIDSKLSQIREKLPNQHDKWHEWVYLLDHAVCGDTQVPAIEFVGLGSDDEALKLAMGRCARGMTQMLELGGDAVGVFGVNADMGVVAAVGLGIALTARLADGVIENANGSRAQNIIREINAPLRNDKRLQLAVQKVMEQNGISDNVVADPNLLYGLELNSTNLKMLDSVARPITTGMSMVMAGNLWGLLVGGIGSLAKPLGQYVLRYEKKEKVPAQKLASNTGEKQLLSFMRRKHIEMVTGIRVLGEAPAFFKLATAIFRNQLGSLFAGTLIGAVDGVQSLSGTVTISREAVAANEKVKSTKLSLDYLRDVSSPVLSDVSYPRHVLNETLTLSEVPANLTDQVGGGLLVHNLKPIFGHYADQGLSAFFKSGELIRILGVSGQGKTVFLESLRHSYNHVGLVALGNNGTWQDVHDLTRTEIRNRIVAISRDSMAARGGRVVDFASDLFEIAVRNAKGKQNDETLSKILNLINDLCPADIEILFHSGYDIAKLNEENRMIGQYSRKLLKSIKPFLELKRRWVDQLLEKYIPASEGMNSLSMFENELSQGQKQRVINTFLRGYFEYSEVDVLILDEIMEGLDAANAQKTIDDLYRLVNEREHKPVIMWLAHTRNDLPEKRFGSSYREFDLRTSLYEDERVNRIDTVVKEGAGYFNPEELQILGESIANAKLYLETINIRDLNVGEMLIDTISEQIEGELHIEWIDFARLVEKQVGFEVTYKDIIKSVERIWSQPSLTGKLEDKYLLYDMGIWTLLNVPLITWFDYDTLGRAAPMSVGDSTRIRGRISEGFDNETYHITTNRGYSDWQRWVIKEAAKSVVIKSLGNNFEAARYYIHLIKKIPQYLEYPSSRRGWTHNMSNYWIYSMSLEEQGIQGTCFVDGVVKYLTNKADELGIPELSYIERHKLDALLDAANGIYQAEHYVNYEKRLIDLDR